MGVRSKITKVGVAGAVAGAFLFTPWGNNLAKEIFYKDGEVSFLRDLLPEEMSDAAYGRSFDTSRFKTDDRVYTDITDAVGDVRWYSGTLNDHRVSAAIPCGLLAVNEYTIPDAALTQWKAAEALTDSAKANTAFDAIGKLCLDAFPPIAPGGGTLIIFTDAKN